jgi:predicted transcriptional regulator
MSKTVTIDFDEPVLEALDRVAECSSRTRADIIAEAVRDYLETQRWQIEKIEAGIAAADRGDFASEEEIERIVGKYAIPEWESPVFQAAGYHAN